MEGPAGHSGSGRAIASPRSEGGPLPRALTELSCRGPPTGPHVLMKRLRGELSFEQVDAEIDHLEEHKAKSAPAIDPMKKLHRCTQCLLTCRTPYISQQ